MTDAQIETAARHLCTLRGIDPTFWIPAAVELRARLQVDEVLATINLLKGTT